MVSPHPVKRFLKHVWLFFWGMRRFVIAVVVVGAGVWLYYRRELERPTTQDARTDALVVGVAPRISGQIKAVLVRRNQFVKEGSPLLRLDRTDAELAVAAAEARLSLARIEIATLKEGLAAARAELVALKATADYLVKERKRNEVLAKDQTIDPEQLGASVMKAEAARAAVQAQRRKIAQIEKQLGPSGTPHPRIVAASVALKESKVRLKRTVVYASVDGYVTNLQVGPGDHVAAGQPIFGLIRPRPAWVVADILEIFLRNIRPGQRAVVTMRMYGEREFEAVVESVGYGIATAHRLSRAALPKVAPTFNWIRLTQRFPVRLRLLDVPRTLPLPVGANATVTIYTDQQAKLPSPAKPKEPEKATP